MSEVDGMARAMKLCDRQIEVDIDGRAFVLKQMPRLPLQKIIDLLYVQPPEEKGKKKERTYTESIFADCDHSFPIVARMLGFDPDKGQEAKADFNEVVQYLNEHLPPMAAARLYEQWYELNELDDFFARFGKTLLDPKLAVRLKEEHLQDQARQIEQIISDGKAEAAVET